MKKVEIHFHYPILPFSVLFPNNKRNANGRQKDAKMMAKEQQKDSKNDDSPSKFFSRSLLLLSLCLPFAAVRSGFPTLWLKRLKLKLIETFIWGGGQYA